MLNKVIKNYNQWIRWTHKSNNITYSRCSDYGAGEKKLAAEFNTKPLGQNFTYDLLVDKIKFEVKEQDKDGSFRLGVESLSDYSEIIIRILLLFNNVKELKEKLSDSLLKKDLIEKYDQIFNKYWGSSKTFIYDGFKKSEVSESNLNATDRIIEHLKELTKTSDFDKVELYSPKSGHMKKFCIEDAYDLLNIDNSEIDYVEKKLGENYNLAVIKSHLRELNFFEETSLKSKLNNVIRHVFSDKKLVFVNKEKGYKIIDDYNKLVCYRITQGGPRCKYPL